MTSRLDTSPTTRLCVLARNLSLTEQDAKDALRASAGDEGRAESILIKRANTSVLAPLDRVKKAAAALALTPDVLDILEASLTKVLQQPHAERLRKVNVTSGAFFERVASKGTAGVALMYAVGYTPMHGHLVLQNHDAALLRAALETLAAARQTTEYREKKAELDGATARRQAASRDEEAARARRAAYLAKVPEEPTAADGASACVITIRVGESKAAGTKRRFDSANTLEDLYNFVRSLEGAPEGELVVTNVTTRPPKVLDPQTHAQVSLYALDLWPVSQVRVVSAAA